MAIMSEDAVKSKPKSSVLLYLLLAVTALVLLCAATIVYLVLGGRGGGGPAPAAPVNATSSPLFLVPEPSSSTSAPTSSMTVESTRTKAIPIATTSTLRTQITTTARATTSQPSSPTYSSTTSTRATTTVAEPSSTTELPTTTEPSTTTTSTTTQSPAILPTPLVDENKEMIDKCSVVVAERVTCPKTKDDVVTLLSSALSPLHYSLNLSVQTVQPTVIGGDVQIFVRLNEEGKQITLSVDSKLRNVEEIRVVNCDTGATLCVAKTVYDQREQHLSLLLSETVPAGTNLRVDVLNFTSVNNKDIIYSQIAPRWNRNAPVMVGTLLTSGLAKQLFPVFESSSYRSTFDLCVKFTSSGHTRSNSATKLVSGETTCFERSVPLAAEQIAFAGFEKAETLIYNKTVINETTIPAVEIVFSLNKNFKREKHQWIYNELSKVISLMTKWTDFPYPLSALHVISAPIRASSHSSPGLITLQDRLVEHPSYTLAHTTLMHATIKQWLSGIVNLAMTEQACFAESLTTYLEWKLDEELKIGNKTRASEIESIRPQDLSMEGKDETRFMRSLEMIHSCPERLTSIFYTIDETFGEDTVTGILKYILRNFAYASTTIEDWQRAADEVTGNEHAGLMIGEWFSRKSRAVLHLEVAARTIEFEQLTDELWTVPVEIAGSSGIQLVAVTNRSMSLPYSSNDYVIADPRRKSTTMIIYDVDSYIRLIRCWDDTRCPANHAALEGIIRDLVAVLLTDRLQPPTLMDVPKWKAVFKFARNNRMLRGNAACCAEYAVSRTAEIACTWVIRDTCEKIRLFQTIATSGV